MGAIKDATLAARLMSSMTYCSHFESHRNVLKMPLTGKINDAPFSPNTIYVKHKLR
jgi:hypothetical protein